MKATSGDAAQWRRRLLAARSGLQFPEEKDVNIVHAFFCFQMLIHFCYRRMFSSRLFQFKFLSKVKLQKSSDAFMMSQLARRCVTASYSTKKGLFVCL